MSKFASPETLLQIVAAQKRSEAKGIYSVCSANRTVIEACMLQALEDKSDLLIESSSNQVNQYGGYMGLTPSQFAGYVQEIAAQMAFPIERLILGGDHLGPHPWQNEPAEISMYKSCQLVQDCTLAGYTKIHIDASMSLADDAHTQPLDPELSAQRAADLCIAAENAHRLLPNAPLPIYVIGTEVPVPGGASADHSEVQITDPGEAKRTWELFQAVFETRGLGDAWQRVIALVVQPGVEFSNAEIQEYDSQKALGLAQVIEELPGVVYEAHSTDYQRPDSLRQMVKDHFAILKVGPALTFAFREAVFALAHIEDEWLRGRSVQRSNLIKRIEDVMLEVPEHWAKYYSGDELDQAFARKYSFSDRIRYYWQHRNVQEALRTLMHNLERDPIPLPMISQYLPDQYGPVREGRLRNEPSMLVRDHIRDVAAHYAFACAMN